MTWVLDEVMELIRDLQPKVRLLGYHIALGGGVLNNGQSDKDLDLYFLPIYDDNARDSDGVIELLNTKWGLRAPLGGRVPATEAEYLPESLTIYTGGQFTYAPGGRRIDVFVA